MPLVDELFLKETPVLVVVFDRNEWVAQGFGEAFDLMLAEPVAEVGDTVWWVYSSQGYANIGQNLQDVKGLVKQKDAQVGYLNGCLAIVTDGGDNAKSTESD